MSLMSVVSHFFANQASTMPSSIEISEKMKLIVPEDATLRRHFLTQLRADIENALLPKMPDPSLKHYYEASVAAEYQKRLAEAVKY